MTNNNEQLIVDTIFNCIHVLNKERDMNDQIIASLDTYLFGESSILDSLSLVSIIVDIETAISDQFNIEISLTDDKAMSATPVPFTSVITLRDYIFKLIK